MIGRNEKCVFVVGGKWAMTVIKNNASRIFAACLAVAIGAGVVSGCDNPKADIKDLKSVVQVTYGSKNFRESAKAAAEGLKLSLEHIGPKHPDTLYFAQAVSEAYMKMGDKKNAVVALGREVELRLGAGQTEEKLQARRTFAIKFAEETGDRAIAAKHALAISKAIGMAKGKDPQPVYRPETKYPPDLYTSGVEGDVTIAYTLDTDGAVLDAKIVKAVPKDLFDTVAVASFKTWRFTPMLENGAAVKSAGHQFTLMFRTGKLKTGAP
jgi:TonB family protein